MRTDVKCYLVYVFALLMSGAGLWATEITIGFAPRDSVYAAENVQLWALLHGPRQQLPDWHYRWDLTPGAGVVVTTLSGGSSYEDFIADSRNLCCPTTIALADGVATGTLGLRLMVSDADGQGVVLEKYVRVLANRPPRNAAELEERRLDAIARGLHWLMLVQESDGCWCKFLLDESQYKYHRAASTASALWAFGNCGYGLSRQQDNPFLDVVREGIEFLLRESDIVHLTPVAGRDTDSNHNGLARVLGRHTTFENYIQPMALAGIISAGLPRCSVTRGGQQYLLLDDIKDACDFTTWQLFSHSSGSWGYNVTGIEGGHDLSVAGWNFIGMEAMAAWDIALVPEVFLRCKTLLENCFQPATGKFAYYPGRDDTSISLTASGILGVYMLSQAAPDNPSFQYYDSLGLSAGEIITRALGALNEALSQSGPLKCGYFYWVVSKTLQRLQIQYVHINGRWLDWRRAIGTGPDSWDGFWQQIINSQEPSGKWTFVWDNFGYTVYSDELETAFMLLTLSDQLVSALPAVSTVNVTASLPEALAASLSSDDFTVQLPDNRGDNVRAVRALQMADLHGGAADLWLKFMLPAGQPDEQTTLQKELSLTYLDKWGRERQRHYGPLTVRRLAPQPTPEPEEPPPVEPEEPPPAEPEEPPPAEPEEPPPVEPEEPPPVEPEEPPPVEPEEPPPVEPDVPPPVEPDVPPPVDLSEESESEFQAQPVVWWGAVGRLVGDVSDVTRPTMVLAAENHLASDMAERPVADFSPSVKIRAAAKPASPAQSRIEVIPALSRAVLGEINEYGLGGVLPSIASAGTVEHVVLPAAVPATVEIGPAGQYPVEAVVAESAGTALRLNIVYGPEYSSQAAIELPSDQASELQVLLPVGPDDVTNRELCVAMADELGSEALVIPLNGGQQRRPYVLCAKKNIALGGHQHDLSPDVQVQAARVLPATLRPTPVQNIDQRTDWDDELGRRWLALAEIATRHQGNLLVDSADDLPAGLCLVTGDVVLSLSGPVQCTILATGRIRVKSRQAIFRPRADNMLFFAEKGIDLAGGGNGFLGDICAPAQRIYVRGRQQRFAAGGLWGRSIIIHGAQHAFISHFAYEKMD